MLWGHTLRSPHAHARIRCDRHHRGSVDGGRPRRSHARRRPRPEDVRARVHRPAGARRSTASSTTASRSRSSQPSIPSRRVARPSASSSTTSRSSRSPTWSVRPSWPDLHPDKPTRGHGYREDDRPNVVRHMVIRHGDPKRRGDVSVEGVYEIGIQDQAFLGPESGLAVPDGEGGVDIYVATQWLHVDRAQVAPCLGLPARAGADPSRRCRRRVRRPRGPVDAGPRCAARAAHEPAGEDRLQPRGVVHRATCTGIRPRSGASTARHATGSSSTCGCGSCSTAAPTPRARRPSRRTPPRSRSARTRRRTR